MTSHLLNLCKHYRKHEEIIAHLIPVLNSFTGLHPEQNDFVYDDGRVELLLSITGTIQVLYRGNPYHCPLAIWLPLEYPSKPPMVRVVPSSTMQIRVGKCVDPNGQVMITYLEDWERKGEGRSLLPLLEDLRAQFGIEYPLQLISANPSSQQQPSRPPPLPSNSSPIPPSNFPPRPPPPPQSYSPGPHRSSLDGRESMMNGGGGLPPRPAFPPNFNGGPENRTASPLPNHQSQSPPSLNRQPYSSPPPRPPMPPNQSPTIQSANLPPRPPLPPFRSSTIDQPQNSSLRPSSLLHNQSPPSFRPPPPSSDSFPPSNLSPSPFPPSNLPQFQPPTRAGTLPNYSPTSSPILSSSNIVPLVRPTSQNFSSPLPVPQQQQWQPQIQTQGNSNQYPSQQPPPLPYYQPAPPSSSSIPTIGGLHPASALLPRQQQQRPIASRLAAVNILDEPEDMLSDISPTTTNHFSSTPSTSSNAPPPRPPNPELLSIRSQLHSKLSLSLQTLYNTTSNQLEQMNLIEQDLLKGVPAIKDEMSRLEAVKSVCEGVRSRYRIVVEEGEGRLRLYHERGEGPEVDEIVCSSTVVYNQLLELVAEDAALEDTIYHLGRGLNSETANIDLDQFLKRVRGLAREQFGKRALINKILLSLAMRKDSRT